MKRVTEILAGRNGVIVRVKEDSNRREWNKDTSLMEILFHMRIAQEQGITICNERVHW